MALSRKTKIILIVGGIVVVAGGIGAYFLFKKPKINKKQEENKNQAENKKEESTVKNQTETQNQPQNSNVNTQVNQVSTNNQSNNISLENYKLDTVDKIKAFQDWMDAQGKGWILKNGKWLLLNKGAGYGNYGSNTARVWKVYGSAYLKSL
jgi:lipopolysaccharide export LptBFGC system permease protein LptF